MYRELHGNTKPVDRAALALSKEMVKLPWGKQEPDTGYGLSIFGSVLDNGLNTVVKWIGNFLL